ncbi:MAG: redox-sensing transcriptional repressor Rex [Clostridiales bacterium]|jgi:redox-sensing transcriptional repressor|nr:redox-sensing transcriptional repressor Rex [Clostridiales bacterium]
MSARSRIPGAVIRRLPRYYRYLSTLHQLGIVRVSSRDMSKALGLTSSQIRQDFSNLGGLGLQGYGYDVDSLLKEIGIILGLDTMYNLIIIGAGNLGHALSNYQNFEKRGFRIIGVFDVDQRIIGKKVNGLTVMHMDELSEFLKENKADIAAITVPRTYAREVAEKVISLGIRGIWNFAPVELEFPDDIVVENIHLSDSLMVLGYNLKQEKKENRA